MRGASSPISCLVVLIGIMLVGSVGQSAADEICLGTGFESSRFHLQITGTAVTTVGTVLNVAGIRRTTGEVDLRNAVSGTIFIEPSAGLTQYRIGLLETGSPGTQNLIWNARLGVIVGFAATNLIGPFSVDMMPAGLLLTNRVSGVMTLVNCQTGTAISL